MSSIKLIISDLHLADGYAPRDGFGDAQQAALEGLLNAASSGSLLGRSANHIELIINGDCFDFLAIPPFQKDETTNPTIARGKLEKVIAAHDPFFKLLQKFLSPSGRSVTFLTGNHDIELCFEEVRFRIAEAISGQTIIPPQVLRRSPIYCGPKPPMHRGEAQSLPLSEQRRDDKFWNSESSSEGVRFCPSRFYHPLPDVYIEHGNQYDFWNASFQATAWEGLDEKGQPLIHSPENISLPIGSQYVLRVGYPISQAYPYFDHFEPSMNILRQIALLSLIDPNLTRETAERLMGMLSYPRKALAHLAPDDERIPARLFEHAMQDFLAFQQDVQARFPEWKTNSHTSSSESNRQDSRDSAEPNEEAIMEFLALRDALSLPPLEAIAAICIPVMYSMGEDVARGMRQVLRNDPELRYAIAGHSHMRRVDTLDNGQQTYLNTGTWTKRIALPAPDEVTPALVEWLRQPDWKHIPLRDMTQYTFIMIATGEDGSSEICLCAWEGGANGSYRVIG